MNKSEEKKDKKGKGGKETAEVRGLDIPKISAWLEEKLGGDGADDSGSSGDAGGDAGSGGGSGSNAGGSGGRGADFKEPFLPPYEFELIAAGGSNLTYRIAGRVTGRITNQGSGTSESSGNQSSNQGDSQTSNKNSQTAIALRRPPEAARLASAHDMGREWKVMSALANSPVPVPKCIAYEADPEILGADFYIMDFVGGIILRDTQTVPNITPEAAAAATKSLIEIQAAMHTLDLNAVGLADLGKHEDYIGRQLKRWKHQVDTGGVRSLPLHTEIHDRLAAAKPPETAQPSLVHGDYRFDNCILGPDWKVIAVLDWELCTIGNPTADFVWSLQYWAEPGDEFTWLTDSPTLNPAFMSREEYCLQYEKASGLNLADIEYYKIFSWWKQASIVEGVYARVLAGAGGGSMEDESMESETRAEHIAERVDGMLEYAADMAAGVLP